MNKKVLLFAFAATALIDASVPVPAVGQEPQKAEKPTLAQDIVDHLASAAVSKGVFLTCSKIAFPVAVFVVPHIPIIGPVIAVPCGVAAHIVGKGMLIKATSLGATIALQRCYEIKDVTGKILAYVPLDKFNVWQGLKR
jgi:hypothetical protein